MDEELLALAMELGGVKKGEEQGLLLSCQLAREELTGMLKPGIAPSDCAGRFAPAAAKMGLCDWLALRRAVEPGKFTAGDVTVEAGRGDPARLRRQALRQMAPYLTDPAFFLWEVKS